MEMLVIVIELEVNEKLGWCTEAGYQPGVSNEVGLTLVAPSAV